MSAVAKAEQARHLADAWTQILSLHHESFPEATPLNAARAPRPNLREIQMEARSAALKGVGLFEFAKRREVKAAATQQAQARYELLTQAAVESERQEQGVLDQWWKDLNTNNPEVVLGVLSEAFEDNEAAAAPLGIEGSTAYLVVHVPRPDILPEKFPGVTEAGNLSIRKLTKRQASDYYKLLVCGYVLVTVKEAFAVAPGITEAAIVAVRASNPDAYGRPHAEAVMAVRIFREALIGIRWDDTDAVQVLNAVKHELVLNEKGATKALEPLDIAQHPDLSPALAAIDLDATDT